MPRSRRALVVARAHLVHRRREETLGRPHVSGVLDDDAGPPRGLTARHKQLVHVLDSDDPYQREMAARRQAGHPDNGPERS